MRILDLWNNLPLLQGLSMIAALLLTVGAVIEYWTKLNILLGLFGRLLLLRSTAFERCALRKLFIHTAGPLLVVLGIAGELVFESRSFIVEDQESTAQHRQILTEIDARVTLEKKLLFQGPRVELLFSTRVDVGGIAKQFAPQKIEFRINPSGIADPNERSEMLSFFQSLNFLIGQVGGWLVTVKSGDNGWGLTLVVNRNAPPKTKDAARALASALADAGFTDMQRRRLELREVQEGTNVDKEHLPTDLILLYVGKHP